MSIVAVDMLVAFVEVEDLHVDIAWIVAVEGPFVVVELSGLPLPYACFAACC